MPHGTAAGRLRKAVLFKYVQLAGHDVCYRCGFKIESAGDMSIEHTVEWQRATDPVGVFFDVERIAFSHLRCNSMAADASRFVCRNTGKTHCDYGHEFTVENTWVRKNRGGTRDCKICRRRRVNEARRRRREESRLTFNQENTGSNPVGGAN